MPKRNSKQSGFEFCPGYVDANNVWINGFPCPRSDKPIKYCCGNEEKKFCCGPNTDVPDSSVGTGTIPKVEPGATGTVDSIPMVIGISALTIAILTMVILVYCYFCKCCMLYKRRKHVKDKEVERQPQLIVNDNIRLSTLLELSKQCNQDTLARSYQAPSAYYPVSYGFDDINCNRENHRMSLASSFCLGMPQSSGSSMKSTYTHQPNISKQSRVRSLRLLVSEENDQSSEQSFVQSEPLYYQLHRGSIETSDSDPLVGDSCESRYDDDDGDEDCDKVTELTSEYENLRTPRPYSACSSQGSHETFSSLNPMYVERELSNLHARETCIL